MVGQYLWGTLKTHRVMDEFLWEQFRQHTEVAPHINIYLFEHRASRVEVVALRKKAEIQYETIIQIEKTCK